MAEMTPAEQAFYEWYNANPQHQGGYVPITRDIWIAGWDAAADFIRLALPDDGEAGRIAETFDRSAGDYARIERGQL